MPESSRSPVPKGARTRAVSAEQKEARRRAILDAADDLFDSDGYDTLSISRVARHSGIAKGTVYLYFGTKEELFLTLYEESYSTWIRALLEGMNATDALLSIPRVATLLSDSVVERRQLLRLNTILHTRLALNVESERLDQFRQRHSEESSRVGGHLEQHFEFLRPGEGVTLFRRIEALIIGLAHTSELLGLKTSDDNEAGNNSMELFRQALYETLTILFIGVKAIQRSR